MCVRDMDFASVSTIFLLNFGTFPKSVVFLFYYYFLLSLYIHKTEAVAVVIVW